MWVVRAKYKIWKTKQTKPPKYNFNCLFCSNSLVYRKTFVEGHYLSNRVFLSRSYRLIVAPRKVDVLKTSMFVLRTLNFQVATIRPIVPRHNTLLSLLFTTKSSSARLFKNHIELSSTLLDERRLSQRQNLKKKTGKNPLNTISIV